MATSPLAFNAPSADVSAPTSEAPTPRPPLEPPMPAPPMPAPPMPASPMPGPTMPGPPMPGRGRSSSVLGTDEGIRRSVQKVLRVLQMHPDQIQRERRRHRRYAFPYPVELTPLDARSGTPLSEERFVVLGKHLSERGFDFYHNAPVPYRRVIAAFSSDRQTGLMLPRLVLALAWCRFGQHGWYENGGRFLHVVEEEA